MSKNLKITLVSDKEVSDTKRRAIGNNFKMVSNFHFAYTNESTFSIPKRVNKNTLELVIPKKISESIDDMEDCLFILKRASKNNTSARAAL